MAKAETTKEHNSTSSMINYGSSWDDSYDDEKSYDDYFAYELEGDDGEWSDDDGTYGTYWWDDASYTYAFQVESELDDSLWDESGTFKGFRKGKARVVAPGTGPAKVVAEAKDKFRRRFGKGKGKKFRGKYGKGFYQEPSWDQHDSSSYLAYHNADWSEQWSDNNTH